MQDTLAVRPTHREPEVDSGPEPPQEGFWDTCLGVVPTPTIITDPTQVGAQEAGGGAMGGAQVGVQGIHGVRGGIVAIQEHHTRLVGVVPVPVLVARGPGLLQDLEEQGEDKH